MGLVYQGDAELAGTEFGLFSGDLEDGPSLEDQEDFVSQVVAVAVGHLARLQAHEAGADLRRDEQIANILAEIENSKGHGVTSGEWVYCW